MSVFKYVNQYGPDILANLEIYVSAATKLNDPFELSPRMDIQLTVERVMKALRSDSEVNRCYNEEGHKLGYTNRKQFKRYYLSTIPQRAAELMPKIPENVEYTRSIFAEIFDECWRLFSTSSCCDSILMWSHYAEKHSGAVIEFDFSEELFISEVRTIPVEYSPKIEKPLFRYKLNNDDSFREAVINVVKTKSEEWSYEKEVRFLFPVKMCREGHFIKISPKSIRQVIFGCRSTQPSTQRYRDDIMKILDAPMFSHVTVSEMSPSKETYSLEIKCIRKPSL